MFPAPIFLAEDLVDVWVWPTIMAVAFAIFMRGEDVVDGVACPPIAQRLLSRFVLFATVWLPFGIVGDAIERGAENQGLAWPAAWGFGLGILAMLGAFALLLLVAAMVKPFGNWLGLAQVQTAIAGKA